MAAVKINLAQQITNDEFVNNKISFMEKIRQHLSDQMCKRHLLYIFIMKEKIAFMDSL